MEKKFLAKSYGFYSHFYFELKKNLDDFVWARR